MWGERDGKDEIHGEIAKTCTNNNNSTKNLYFQDFWELTRGIKESIKIDNPNVSFFIIYIMY